MNLKSLIMGYEFIVKNNLNVDNINVGNITFDSRKCINNSLFVCIVGYKTDGHKFINSAIENGAKVICYCQELDTYEDGIIYIKCKNTRNALAYLSNKFYSFPSKKLKLIGISGTNGKTSFCDIGNVLFNNCGLKSEYIGTLGRTGENISDKVVRTTPEITTLTKDFAQMVNNDTKYCFLEVSSHGLVLDRVSYLNFYVGVFSNLSMDHLDFHKTMEEYYKAKKKLYYMVDKYSVINIDDKYGFRLYNELKEDNKEVVSFGERKSADYQILEYNLSLENSKFTIKHLDNEYKFTINSIGKFNIYNTVPNIIIALKENIPYNDIQNALNKYTGTSGRVEKVYKDIFIDYAHTPDAMENVLKLAKEVSNKKISVVFGCGGDRDHNKRSIMGSIAQQYAHKIIVTMDNPRHEDNKDIMNSILSGITNKEKVTVIEDRYCAIQEAIVNKKEDEVIFVLGKGHETYQEIGDRKNHFSDKESILEIINNK